jgi:hypothetical protein
MRPSPEVLPRALKDICTNTGLEYLTHAEGLLDGIPVACTRLPVFKDPINDIPNLPMRTNFACEVLDMDNPDDKAEYVRIMEYARSSYGMHIVSNVHKFVTKVTRSGGKKKKKLVQKVFIEYYAPYRVAD